MECRVHFVTTFCYQSTNLNNLRVNASYFGAELYFAPALFNVGHTGHGSKAK